MSVCNNHLIWFSTGQKWHNRERRTERFPQRSARVGQKGESTDWWSLYGTVFGNRFSSPTFNQDYDAQDLQEFQKAILSGCDYNKDGKINKKELTMILLALSKHSQDEWIELIVVPLSIPPPHPVAASLSTRSVYCSGVNLHSRLTVQVKASTHTSTCKSYLLI